MRKGTSHRVPASTHVQQVLHERIITGFYGQGEWLPAERDLAEELGVSRPVVREALSELQSEGIIERLPHQRPRVLATPKSLPATTITRRTIAAILPQQPTYVTAHALLRGINDELTRQESVFQLSVFDTHPTTKALMPQPTDEARENSYLKQIAAAEVAGVILWHHNDEKPLTVLRRLQERGVPVIFVDRYPENFPCDFVGVDNHTGVQESVEYLLELGHRRFAFLMDNGSVSSVQERVAGFEEGLRCNSIPSEAGAIYHVPRSQGGPVPYALKQFALQSHPPTAVVASNDLIAFQFLQEARAQGYRIPGDISLVGFDDIEYYSPHPATLTTVRQSFFRIGQRAAALLLERLKRPDTAVNGPYQHILLPTKLIVRATCSPPGH